jgi:hypothetical protein
MERLERAQTPYEVYCYHCHVTFPPEARRCIHCGGRLGPPGPPRRIDDATLGTAPRIPDGRRDHAGTSEEDIEDASGLLLRRFGGLAVWALLALAAILSNLCQGRG